MRGAPSRAAVITRDALTPELCALDEAVFDLAARYLGLGPYEDEGLVPTEAALQAIAADIERQRVALAACTTPPSMVVFAAHLHECCDWLAASIDDDRDYPVNPLRTWISALQRRLHPIDPIADRGETERFLLARLTGADAFLTALVDGAAHAPSAHLEHCLRRLAPLDAELGRAESRVRASPDAKVLTSAIVAGRAAVAHCSTRLIAAMSEPREERVRCRHEDVVAQKFGFDLDAIRGWCDDELALVRSQLAEAIGASPSGAFDLTRVKGFATYPDARSLRLDAEEALGRARAVAAERVALPSGERLVLADVPDTDRDKLPFGAYSGGSVLRGDVTGRWLLNLANLRGLHRGWVWMMALHEGYPGHHVHYAKTAVAVDLPRTFRIPGYGPSQGLVEGVAHRSEAYLETFEDRREVWPMVPYRRLQTLLRIKTQLMLSVDRKPPAEAIASYTGILGLDRQTASALVRSQKMNPGRTYSYYTGYHALRELKKDSRLSEAEFTETVFSNGFVSLATMSALVRSRCASP